MSQRRAGKGFRFLKSETSIDNGSGAPTFIGKKLAWGLRYKAIENFVPERSKGMSFEVSRGETESGEGDGFGSRHSPKERSRHDSIRSGKRVRSKVEEFLSGLNDKTPGETLRTLREAAGQAKVYVSDAAGQAEDYMKNTTVRRMLGDVAGLIKRYPWFVMATGMVLGFLVSRKSRNSLER